MSHLSNRSPDDERRAAWSVAKLAVRSYARVPTASNAGRVRSAWRRVRAAMTRAVDRRVEMELAELDRRKRYR
jgi:hypothetical protein